MPTYTEVLPASKSSPHGALNWTPAVGRPGCGELVVHTARASVTYRVTEFPTPWDGRAFRLVKVGPGTDPESDAYDVFVHRGGQDHRCCCKGFTFGRGKPCKHVAATIALIENGWA